MIESTVRELAGLDLVLINAGGNLERKRVGEDSPEGWEAVLSINLFGAYYTAREAFPHLTARGGGRIVAMGSGMGHRSAPGAGSYAVAKAGLWMLVRVLAQKLVEHNICVNKIIPGPVWTPATREEDATDGWPVASQPHEWLKEPEDVAPLAVFLASHRAPGPTAQSFSLMRRDN